MATYKVIQDIEAEDKFVGPLTLKQFIFGMIGIFFGYLSIFALQKGFPYALIVFVPPMLIGFFLAVPWSKDQPTEIWLVAKLRFYFKPRRRIWDQSGIEELVTITAPKKEEKQLTDNLSQTEVKSRLQALAKTIDSRGWVVKEAEYMPAYQQNTDERLISPATLPHEVPPIDLNSITDVYTEETATSQNFDRMIQQSEEIRREQNMQKLEQIRQGVPLESIQLPEVHLAPPSLSGAAAYQEPVIDEESLTKELKNRKAPDIIAKSHMRTIKPLAANPSTAATNTSSDDSTGQTQTDEPAQSQTSRASDENTQKQIPEPTAILEYAGNNDLDIATIARQAKKDADDEIVISLR